MRDDRRSRAPGAARDAHCTKYEPNSMETSENMTDTPTNSSVNER